MGINQYPIVHQQIDHISALLVWKLDRLNTLPQVPHEFPIQFRALELAQILGVVQVVEQS